MDIHYLLDFEPVYNDALKWQFPDKNFYIPPSEQRHNKNWKVLGDLS